MQPSVRIDHQTLPWRAAALGLVCTALAGMVLTMAPTIHSGLGLPLPAIPAVWPLNGLLLGLCFLSSTRAAAAYLLAMTVAIAVAYLLAHTPPSVAIGLSLANLVEILLAGWPLRLVMKQWRNLGHPNTLAMFTVFGIFIGPMVSGLLAGQWVGWMLGHGAWEIARAWIPANALGMAVFAPLSVAFSPSARAAIAAPPWRPAPVLLRLLVLLLTVALVFFSSSLPFLFALAPPLVWLTFEMGFAGAPLGAALVIAIGFPMTMAGMNPTDLIPGDDLTHRYLVLQLFLGMMLLINLPIGMVLDHRTRLLDKLRQREADLLHQAEHDHLTGLLNRRGFEARFLALPTDQPDHRMAMVVLDVDWFKDYNDAYGHPMGDACLVWVASRMNALLEATGALAAGAFAGRLGGEEFGAVLVGVSGSEALAWAEQLRDQICRGHRKHASSPLGVVTVSVGVAARSGLSRIADRNVLLDADQAMYLAKAYGRNSVHMHAPRADSETPAEGFVRLDW